MMRFSQLNNDVFELINMLGVNPDTDIDLPLIRLMQKTCATDNEIWLALALNNRKMDISDSWDFLNDMYGNKSSEDYDIEEIRQCLNLQNKDYQIARKLLIKPSEVTDPVSPRILYVVASVITARVTQMANFLTVNEKKMPCPYNNIVLHDVCREFAPLIQRTRLWEEFDGQFKKLFSEQEPQKLTTKLHVCSPLYNVRRIKKEALRLGFEVCKQDKYLLIRAHGDDDAFLLLWARYHDFKFKKITKVSSTFAWQFEPANFYDDLTYSYNELLSYCSDYDVRSLSKRLVLRNEFLKDYESRKGYLNYRKF